MVAEEMAAHVVLVVRAAAEVEMVTAARVAVAYMRHKPHKRHSCNGPIHAPASDGTTRHTVALVAMMVAAAMVIAVAVVLEGGTRVAVAAMGAAGRVAALTAVAQKAVQTAVMEVAVAATAMVVVARVVAAAVEVMAVVWARVVGLVVTGWQAAYRHSASALMSGIDHDRRGSKGAPRPAGR